MTAAAVLFALATGVPAPAEAPLTLQEVVAATDRAYPLLLAAQQRRATAAAERLSAEGGFDTALRARAQWLPKGPYEYYRVETAIEQPTPLWGATFFGGWRLGQGLPGSGIPPYYGELETNRGGEVRAGVAIPLLRDGPIDRRRAALAQANLGQEVAQKDVAITFIDVERAAAHRYWDWVVAGRRLAVARELLAIAETRDEAVRRRAELGEVPSIDRTDNQRAILERRERVVAADRLLEQAALQLSLFLRDPQGQPVVVAPARLPGALPEPVAIARDRVDRDVERALAQRPELRRLRLLREQNDIELRYARNQLLPALDVNVTGSRDFGAGDPKLNKTELSAGVVFDLPLQRRAARGRLQAAQAALARLEAETTMARDRVATDVRDALSALDAASRRVALARDQRALALQLARAERTRFDLGDSTLLFVNLREQASADAALVEAEALGTWLRSLADYHAAVGDRQSGALPP